MNDETATLFSACATGCFRPQRIDDSLSTADGVKVIILNLLLSVCEPCGEIAIPVDAATANA